MNLNVWLSYPLVTILASLPFYVYIHRRGGAQSKEFPSRLRLLMWVPAITAFGLRTYTGQGFGDVHFDAGRWPLLGLAVLLPLAVEVALILLVTLLGWASLSERVLRYKNGQVEIGETVGLILGGRRQSALFFLGNLLLSVIIGSIYTALFTVGSEFGWRAFMLPRSIDTLGLSGGFLVTGLAWGVWLLPLVWAGYRYPRFPRLGALILMSLNGVVLTVVSGVLLFASGSLWAPTLLHAGVMVTTDLSRVGLKERGDSLQVQLLWIALWTLVAGIVYYSWI